MKYNLQRVRIVSYLFILIGSAAWLQFAITYASNGLFIPGIEMILLPSGLGLRRHSDGWRKVSIGVAVAGMLVVILVPVLGYTVSPVMNVRIFGNTIESSSTVAIVFVFVYATLLVASLLWVTFALSNKEVKQIFSKG